MNNNDSFGESKQQITEIISTKQIFELAPNFKDVKLKKVKDVSCLQVFMNTLYVGTKESKVFVYELAKGKTHECCIETNNQRSFYPHCTSAHFIVASSLFLIVVPLEEQQLIRIWNRETLQILHGYKGHEKQITSVIFLSDKSYIASSSYDGTVRIWKISQNFEFDVEERKYQGKYPLLALVEISNDHVAFGGDDSFITIWNWSLGIVRHKCFAHPGSIISLCPMTPNHIFSIGGDSKIRAWRVDEQNKPKESYRNINEIMLGDTIDRKLYLTMVKEFEQKVTQSAICLHITNSQILAMDSKGNSFLMNRHFEISSSKVKLDYTETIRSVKIWQDRLLVVTFKKGKGQIKEITGDFEGIPNLSNFKPQRPYVPTTRVDILTRHSIVVQNQQSFHDKLKNLEQSLTFQL